MQPATAGAATSAGIRKGPPHHSATVVLPPLPDICGSFALQIGLVKILRVREQYLVPVVTLSPPTLPPKKKSMLFFISLTTESS